MDRLDSMRIFVAVAETGGFATAARRLVLSPPAVTRAVAAVEDRVGARLLHRTTRIVRLTEAGARFLEDCRRILAEVEEAEAAAAGLHAEPRGQVSITAPVLFGRLHVAPILFDVGIRHPLMVVRSFFIDRVVNLAEEGYDVAVRIAELPDSGLSAIRVGTVRRVVCASPAYLAAHGVPQTPADLADHDAIPFGQGVAARDWVFRRGDRTETVTPRARLIVNQADVAVAAAVAGHGLTRVLSYQMAADHRAGRLQTVLEDFEPPPIPIHVVHQEGRRATARVRALVDLVAAGLRADPALR
ncbi:MULTISPECIES: LysR family transcriptional regulator [Inquilinus]|uniref:DNA-binding transcriptional LysR family regulator n=1 Tax=Inquilinus ginsengisoli TaxID=363840 RepID=A0ABU1JLN9_9PROT|nr:LysR family transcriptional regulator [Inquilinus ginsengisoli]MDR6289536.1 DNA-binding transcriptional LysR family regulator [Inquilinus ginsengisoli]